MKNDPWYEIITNDNSIYQGDIIDRVPFRNVVEIKSESKASGYVDYYNVIVMSQSCDLEAMKLETVVVCPIWTLKQFGDKKEDYKKPKSKEKLRKGEVIGYHLLNKCNLKGFEKDFLVVDFRTVLSIDIGYMFDFIEGIEKRLRLLSPFREHLSQAFARFFMRVGLPSDIPSFLSR